MADSDKALRERTPHQSLTAVSVSSAKWLYFSFLFIALAQLLVGAILARLLTPEEFGLVATGLILTRLIYYFSQMGVPSALIQRPVLTQEDIESGNAIALLTGLILTVVALLAAPLSALVLPDTASVIIAGAMGTAFIIAAPGIVGSALLRRKMHYRRLALIELSSYLFGYLPTALVLAVGGAGAWSIVIAQLVQSALQAAGYLTADGWVRPRFHPGHVRPLLSFGGKVSILGLMEYLSFQTDTAAVGRTSGAAVLGEYSRANTVVAPIQQLSATGARVLISSFARTSLDALRLAYIDVLALVTLPVGWIYAILLVESGQVSDLLLGPQWSLVPELLPILGLAVLAQAISQIGATLSESRGVLNPKIAIQSVQLLLLLAVAVPGVITDAPAIWFASAWAISEMVRLVLYIGLMRRVAAASLWDQAKVVAQVAIPVLGAVVAQNGLEAVGLQEGILRLILIACLALLWTAGLAWILPIPGREAFRRRMLVATGRRARFQTCD